MDRKKLEARIARLEKLIKEARPKYNMNDVKSALGQAWAAVKVLYDADVSSCIDVDDDDSYDEYIDHIADITEAIELICMDLGIKNEWTYEELD